MSGSKPDENNQASALMNVARNLGGTHRHLARCRPCWRGARSCIRRNWSRRLNPLNPNYTQGLDRTTPGPDRRRAIGRRRPDASSGVDLPAPSAAGADAVLYRRLPHPDVRGVRRHAAAAADARRPRPAARSEAEKPDEALDPEHVAILAARHCHRPRRHRLHSRPALPSSPGHRHAAGLFGGGRHRAHRHPPGRRRPVAMVDAVCGPDAAGSDQAAPWRAIST